MPQKGLGRDGRKITRCLYKGKETQCPDKCDECAIPLKYLADSALRNGDADMAIALYRKATALKPDFAEAWNNLANLLGVMMRFTEALEAFDRALLIDPSYGRAMKGRAVTLMNLFRYDEAAGQFAEAMELYDDEALRRDNDELLRRAAMAEHDLKEAGGDVLRFVVETACDEGLTEHSSVVYVRRVWDRAMETASVVFVEALKASANAATEREAYVAALAECFAAGVKVSEINETATDKELSDAGFCGLLAKQDSAEIVTEAESLSRKAIVEYRNLSGIASYERENGVRVPARSYLECAAAMFLGGVCVSQHRMRRH